MQLWLPVSRSTVAVVEVLVREQPDHGEPGSAWRADRRARTPVGLKSRSFACLTSSDSLLEHGVYHRGSHRIAGQEHERRDQQQYHVYVLRLTAGDHCIASPSAAVRRCAITSSTMAVAIRWLPASDT